MKTLEHIKNDYIKHEFQGVFENWSEFQNYYTSRHPEYFENHWHNVIELVQKECLKRASENANLSVYACDIFGHRSCNGSVDGVSIENGNLYEVNKQSIYNENNLIK